jgi:hypothetical protein
MSKFERMRGVAEKLLQDAEDKLRPRDTHTAKKLAQARTAEREGQQYRRAAALIDAYCYVGEGDALPPQLIDFKPTKQAFLTAAAMRGTNVNNGYHGYLVDSREPADNSPESVTLRWLAEILANPDALAEEQATAKRLEIARAIDGLRNCSIPGFFPTPQSVIDEMLQIADIEDDFKILEPSAGIGSIVDAVRETGFTGTIHALEINSSLCNILQMKGIDHECVDFLDWTEGGYDLIVMNPPFEKRQAIKHVQHAFSLLSDRGMLVSVMPAPHAKELAITNVAEYELPENCFNNSESFRKTGVNVVIIQATKAHSYC